MNKKTQTIKASPKQVNGKIVALKKKPVVATAKRITSPKKVGGAATKKAVVSTLATKKPVIKRSTNIKTVAAPKAAAKVIKKTTASPSKTGVKMVKKVQTATGWRRARAAKVLNKK